MKFSRLAMLGMAVVIAWLAWEQLNLALENDGLRQSALADRRSIEALLTYAKIASRCDLKPEELAKALSASTYPSHTASATQVAKLEFEANFSGLGPTEVGIINVGKVAVCGP